MLRNLFEEYRFYHQYPEAELKITGKLFGGELSGQDNEYKVHVLGEISLFTPSPPLTF